MNQGQPERKILLDEGSSARLATRRPWRLTWIGIGSGVLLLTVVILLDRTPSPEAPVSEARVVDLIGPGNLDPDDGGSVADMLDPRMSLELPRGGWIQVADEVGRLSQQYRCQHLDPAPAELDAYWIAMDEPEVELYMSGDRLITLRGDTALAYAPHRALEEGQFNGHVEIAMFEPRNGVPADPRVATPDLVIRTPRATFDNFLGKITCDGRIELKTAREEMVGRDLQILLNDEDQRIEYLKMATLDYLLIHPPAKARTARRPSARRRLHHASATSDGSGDEPDVYQLTFHGGVKIRQGEGPRARTAVGERLLVTFSLESDQLATPTASESVPAVRTARLPLPVHTTMMALGGVSEDPADDDVLVTCGGQVTMVPLPETAEGLEDPRDARLDLQGAPVVIDDPDRRIRITCPLARYHTRTQRFDLRSQDTDEVTVLTDRFEARGSWMWAEPEAGQAGFVEAGHIKVHGRSPLAGLASDRGPAASEGSPTRKRSPRDSVEMQLTWNGGVDIEFDPDDRRDEPGDPALRSILFRDDVAVVSEDGTISCGSLKMLFARNAEGRAEPERMVALEEVRARNDQQTLWTDQLIVTMEAGGPTAPVDDDLLGGQVSVKDFLATGDVQVLLADGGRAFADRLEGDARQEVAILTGEDVTVARKEMLINHGRRLEISRLTGTATWSGPGQARLLRSPLDVSADRRIVRPSVPTAPPEPMAGGQASAGADSPVTMRARWNQQMVYDSTFNDGAGALELRGKVAVVADGSSTERSTMDGESLTLQFVFGEETPSAVPDRDDADGLDLSGLEDGDRLLEKLIAKGEARLERREWTSAQRTDLPRVFYLAAKHITWDDRQVRAEVIGDGSMVLREPPRREDAVASGPFAGAGTSRFVWSRRLDMIRRPSEQFDISILGDVEGLYRGTTDSDVATITADRVDAVTRRARQGETAVSESPLDLRGDLDIERLRAEGRVYLATPQRRADAHVVEYDTRTQIATLTARPGRKVSVLTEGSPLPVKATEMIWNMDPRVDSIQLIEPSGTGLR